MKKILAAGLIMLALIGVTLFPSQAYAKGAAKASMKFKENVHDFGIVKEDGGPVSCEFTFANEGASNLIIYDASADCGCTRPEYPKAPVAPGKEGKIKVTFNPLGRPGGFTKVITVKTNGSPAKVRVKIKGTVSPKQ